MTAAISSAAIKDRYHILFFRPKNNNSKTIDVEFTWILWQRKNCRQFSLLTWNMFIGQFVHPLGRDVVGKMGGKGEIANLAPKKSYFMLTCQNILFFSKTRKIGLK